MKARLHNKDQYVNLGFVFFLPGAENRNNTFGQKQLSQWSLILEENKKQGE